MQHHVFGVKIDDISKEGISDLVRVWLDGSVPKIITTPNAEFLLKARGDYEFNALLNRSDLAVADSVAVRYAIAALTQGLLQHRNPGVDLVLLLAKLAHEKQKRVLLLGGAPGSATQTKNLLEKEFQGIQVEQHDPGKISFEEEQISIPEKTSAFMKNYNPHIIIVALGQGKQERFMERVKSMLPQTKVMIGVGGAFEMYGGQKKRGPAWMRSTGLEWLWRLSIEPSRSRRIAAATIVFPLVVAMEASKEFGFIEACRKVFPEVYKQFKGL